MPATRPGPRRSAWAAWTRPWWPTSPPRLYTASDADRHVLDEMWDRAGAVVSGARTFDICLDGWGGKPIGGLPWFVLSHDRRERLVRGTGFTFVLDGIESAVDQAKSAAGDKHVVVMGGANAGQQALQSGLVDELQLHVVPVLLGDGIRLFERIDTERIELETTRVIETPDAIHTRFRVRSWPS